MDGLPLPSGQKYLAWPQCFWLFDIDAGGRKVEDCKYCQTGYVCLPASINAFGKQVWH